MVISARAALGARAPGAFDPPAYGGYGGGYGGSPPPQYGGYGVSPPPYGGYGYGGPSYGHYAPSYPPPATSTPPYNAPEWPPMEEALERPPASPEPPPPELPPAWLSPPQSSPPPPAPPPPSPPALPLTDIVGCYQFLGPGGRRLFPANELSAGHGSAGGGVGPNAGPRSFDAAACVRVVANSGSHSRYVGFFNGHMCFGIGGILPPSALASEQPFAACDPCPLTARNSTSGGSGSGRNGGNDDGSNNHQQGEPQPQQLRCGSDTRMAVYDLASWPWVHLAPMLPPMAPWPPEPEDFGRRRRLLRSRRRLRQRTA
ncbi:hypothetical protein HYH02_011102 [Chlamydomonas schloesseri]|uniref:Uncharacterized protein n=1 Tax=Chlamydomonas schloesseri TaxID=2026947 RepID=A0A835T2P2_9CHLO|nr:hypothetical protein HYH02_011102 [Chlamydomonas schloesseri]|eukprot:KAG2437724.1 hypothetical protein HYH02_011102 [Chlamydomonas schloesseri]